MTTPSTAIRFDRYYRCWTIFVNGKALCDCPTKADAKALVADMQREWRGE